MHRLTLRSLALVALTAALSMVLAACGSPAINTSGVDESVAPNPSASSTSGPSTGPTHPGATQTTTSSSPHAATGAQPTSSSTNRSGGTHPSVPPKAPPTRSRGPVAPVCAWQAGTPSVLVVPCANLNSSQTVTVHARGLHPGWGVIVIECVDKGTATGQNDCDLSGAGGLGTLLAGGNQPNANGTITLTLTVNKTFTGGGGTTFTCSGSTHCIVAVTSPQHTSENATAPISFR